MDQVPPPIDHGADAGARPTEPAPRREPAEPRQPGFFDALLKTRATLAFLIVVALLFGLQAMEPGQNLRLPFSDQVYAKYGGYHDCYVLSESLAPDPMSCSLCKWETQNTKGWERSHGQYWRFLSALFVPRWGIDAFVYLFLFWSLGPPLEKLLGTTRFCILYLGAGVGGIAVSGLVAPTYPTPGTILVVYALLGGIPGVILGKTGSIAKTVANPEARGAAFWLAFWIGLGFLQSQGVVMSAGWTLAAEVAAAILAFVFGWALGGGGGPARAALKAGLPALLVVSMVGLVVSGYRWDGGLAKRADIKQGGSSGEDGSKDVGGGGGTTGGGGLEITEPDRAETGKREANPLRAEWEPFLDRFGPLPVLDESLFGPEDDAKVAECYQALTEATGSHKNLILGELDDLRVRCLILMGRHDGPQVADELLALQPSAANRALAAVAYHYRAGKQTGADSERAEDYLESALAEPGLAVELPEAIYFHGVLLYMRGADAEAKELFERYLSLAGDRAQAPRYRQITIDQAKVQLQDE